jgi:hypothetical protein
MGEDIVPKPDRIVIDIGQRGGAKEGPNAPPFVVR